MLANNLPTEQVLRNSSQSGQVRSHFWQKGSESAFRTATLLSFMSSIQARKATKKKVNSSTLYSTVPQTTGRLLLHLLKPQGNVICCDNWQQVRHWPCQSPGCASWHKESPLCRAWPGKGSCRVTLVPAEGMMPSSGCALSRLPHLPLATRTPLCPCTDWPWGGNVNLLENSYTCFLLFSLCVFPLVLFL